MKLTLNRSFFFSLVAALVFVCGVAVGQEVGLHKFDKYLTRSQATELDRKFLSMQMQDIQSTLDVLEQLAVPNRTGVPTYFLDQRTGKIQVLVTVHANWVDKAPLEEVERFLKSQAQDIILGMKLHMREMSDTDAYVTFTKTNVDTNEIVNNFAEYRNGVLTMRH